jgi:hypothetical protein
VSFWGTPNVLPAGSKMEGSCRFEAQGAMIIGKKLPLTGAGKIATSLRNTILAIIIVSLDLP